MLKNMKTATLANKINVITICDTKFVHITTGAKNAVVNKLRM
jgi:hypothetical protein